MEDKIHRFPLFAGLDSARIDRFIKACERRQFRKDERLLKQADKTNSVILLLDGKAGVYAQSPEGIKAAMLFHEAPSLFGHVEVFQQKPMLADVIASEPCVVLVAPRAEFLKLLHESHQAAINLCQIFSGLLLRVARDRRVRLFGRVEHLLANTLCSFAQLYGEEHRYGVLLSKEINKSELAEILGVNRRSIIRAMAQLEEEGLVRLDGKQLIIPNLDSLRQKANAPLPEGI